MKKCALSDYTMVVLISGNGSNLQAIMDAIRHHNLPVRLLAVISNTFSAYGLVRAQAAHIPTHIILHTHYDSRAAFETSIRQVINTYQPALIVLAGFMRRLTAHFVNAYPNCIINIHPALLPRHPGCHTHQRALDAKDTMHGASVHYVTAELDGGPIICQGKLSILPNDTADTLQYRVAAIEHAIYPEAIRWLATHRLRISGTEVFLDGHLLPTTGYPIKLASGARPQAKSIV